MVALLSAPAMAVVDPIKATETPTGGGSSYSVTNNGPLSIFAIAIWVTGQEFLSAPDGWTGLTFTDENVWNNTNIFGSDKTTWADVFGLFAKQSRRCRDRLRDATRWSAWHRFRRKPGWF